VIAPEDVNKLPTQAAKTSFLQSHVTAQQTIVAKYTPLSGPYNDAVLELARLNYWLTYYKRNG